MAKSGVSDIIGRMWNSVTSTQPQDIPLIRDEGSVDRRHPATERYSLPMTHEKPIIAYRAWEARNGTLVSMSRNAVWTPKKRATSQCDNCKNGPGENCECGLWAFKTVEQLVNSYGAPTYGRVIGRVALWGRVQIHQGGYRAQFAYPQLFFQVPESMSVSVLAEQWMIEHAPLPQECLKIIEPYLDEIRRKRFHDKWEQVLLAPPRQDIPILDVEAIRAAENQRRQMDAQSTHFNRNIKYYNSNLMLL